jgi:hypothetical protein
MTDIFDDFASAMRKKFKEALEKDGKRSHKPWTDYSIDFLNSRLHDEIQEFEDVDIGSDDSARECVDIANFCMFIWQKVRTRDFYNEKKTEWQLTCDQYKDGMCTLHALLKDGLPDKKCLKDVDATKTCWNWRI